MNGVYVPIELGGMAVVLSLHTTVDPTQEDWSGYLDVLKRVLKDHDDDIGKMRNLVITDGGAPNATQRKKMTELFRGRATKLGVITNSLENPIKRGVATAITWLNPSFRAVMPAKWRELLGHLDLEPHVDELLLEFDELQKQLPKNGTLSEIKRLRAAEASSGSTRR
jgi:hypothetical protein